MIVINFDLAISLLLSAIIVLVLFSWFRYTIITGNKTATHSRVIQCPYCSHIFHDASANEIKICTRCQSYFEEKKA